MRFAVLPATRWPRASAGRPMSWSSESSPGGLSESDAKRARDLGFKAEAAFDDIVRAHIEDELGGKIAN